MTPERWQQVKEIFNSAIQYEPEKRAAFLSRACGGDKLLRREVESLITSHEKDGSFIDSPAYEAAAESIVNEKAELKPGQVVGSYEIISFISRGGMGEVYLAQDKRLGRRVALKLLPSTVTKDVNRLRRFEQEARAASALNHPNIITIYEIHEANSTLMIATEFVEGETLRQRLGYDTLDVHQALHIAIQIADALSTAHQAGIIHRDIKPENIMIRPDGYVKVLDFGLAKLTEPASPMAAAEAPTKKVKTGSGMIMGTVGYMSPEQARGQAVDARSDVFNLGAVIYEMVAGQKLFDGETPSDILAAILKTEPPLLSHFAPEAPPELVRIVTKALRKDREQRYQTIKDLLLDLQSLKKELEFEKKLERSVAPKSKSAAATEEQAEAETVVESTARLTVSERGPTSAIKLNQGRVMIAVAAFLVIALAAGAYLYFTSARSGAINSIAVLPFVNASGNSDVEYLSDGMTESLINSLSQLPKLSVKARSSVFRYKGKEVEPQQVAAQLSVQAILTGRVVQRGDDLTLYLSLVDGRNGNQLWGEQYNRKLAELVALQQEIARDVSRKLQARLSGADEQKVTKNYTSNPEAYQLYLKGRFSWNKRTTVSLKQAAEFFKQAIEKDPTYALAYAGLAETYVLFSQYNVAVSKDSMPQAKAAALRALELDDSLAAPHAALGQYLTFYEYDRVAGEKEFRRAIELDPNYATAHQWLGTDVLVPTKRFDEGFASLKRAEELDPLSPIIGTNIGAALLYARRYDEAIAQYRRVLSLDPDFVRAFFGIGVAYWQKGMKPEAIAEMRKYVELSGAKVKGELGLFLAKSGQRDEAVRLLRELTQVSLRQYVPASSIALIHLGLGEKEGALDWLEKEIDERGPNPNYYAVMPQLDELRTEPRFKAMLKRLNLPE